MRALRWVLVLGLLALTAHSGVAQEAQRPDMDLPPQALADRAPYVLVLDHVTQFVELRDEKDRIIERWNAGAAGASFLAPVPPDRPVVIEVRNANSLLYDYEVEVTPVATSDIRACRDIGGAFTQQGFLVGLGAVSGQMPQLSEIQNLLAGSGADLFGMDALGASRGLEDARELSQDAFERALDNIRLPLTQYALTLETVSDLAFSLADSLEVVAELGDALPVDSLLEGLQSSLERRESGLSDPVQLPGILRDRTRAAGPQIAALQELDTAVRTGRYVGDLGAPAVREVAQLSRRLVAVQSEAEGAYRSLQRDLLRVTRARSRSVQRFTVAPSRDYRRVSIHTRARDGFDDVLRLREGSATVFTEPAVSLLCQVAIGFTVMDPPADFSVDNGVLTDGSLDETRTSGALMLMVSSPKFPLLGALFGIGIGTHKRPDLYLGGSLRFFQPVMLNAGVVWQREHRLSGDLRLGQPVSDPAMLDGLSKAYRARFFFGVGLAR